jgi:hypothetical protein
MIFVIQYKRVVSRTSWVLGGARDLGLARGECGSISSPLLASLFRVAEVLASGAGLRCWLVDDDHSRLLVLGGPSTLNDCRVWLWLSVRGLPAWAGPGRWRPVHWRG